MNKEHKKRKKKKKKEKKRYEEKRIYVYANVFICTYLVGCFSAYENQSVSSSWIHKFSLITLILKVTPFQLLFKCEISATKYCIKFQILFSTLSSQGWDITESKCRRLNNSFFSFSHSTKFYFSLWLVILWQITYLILRKNEIVFGSIY